MRLEALSRQTLSLSISASECAITFPLKAINEALNKSTTVSLLVVDCIHRQPTVERGIGQIFVFVFCDFVLFCFCFFFSQ